MTRHTLHQQFVDLGICDTDSLEEFFPRVRDRDDVSVWRCRRSGVVMLNRVDHIGATTYAHADLAYWGAAERSMALELCRKDDDRRATLLHPLVRGRVWVDVGTGVGGVLDRVARAASRVMAVEPQPGARAMLEELGYEVYADVASLPDATAEVSSAFHVVEHLVDAVGTLRALRAKMKPGGKLIIEVPHAKDILLTRYASTPFKSFTLWSEHLVLHTRESLQAVCAAAGFSHVTVRGVQRYPLANHLYWLARGLPGGHENWADLRSPDLDASYEAKLQQLDATDTILAHALAV